LRANSKSGQPEDVETPQPASEKSQPYSADLFDPLSPPDTASPSGGDSGYRWDALGLDDTDAASERSVTEETIESAEPAEIAPAAVESTEEQGDVDGSVQGVKFDNWKRAPTHESSLKSSSSRAVAGPVAGE
jgi:hypothetical protein